MYLLARGNKATSYSKRDKIMNNSNIFKLAHKMTKAAIKDGENYQVTFGAALKIIKKEVNRAIKMISPLIAKGYNRLSYQKIKGVYHMILNKGTDINTISVSTMYNNASKTNNYFLSSKGKHRNANSLIVSMTISELTK